MSLVQASLTVQVNGHVLTDKQAKAVLALYLKGTQRAAARSLGISAPVLCRHLRQVEVKASAPIMDCGPRGTVLNELGESIAKEQLALQSKLRERQQLAVACTPLTEELMMQALNVADPKGDIEVVISDDTHNVTDFQAGLLDLVLLDDPLFAYEAEGASWEEVGSDRLLHVRKGEDYASYRFGPQRLGFRSLEAQKVPHRVVRTYSSLGALVRSGHSYFVSEGLLVRKGYRPKGDEPAIPYAILCLYRPVPKVDGILRAIRNKPVN
ncbi:MAG TPA: LysR family transcriptional regulator [Methanomassiliicoccales archaeon]|nr:LysR family transcriptional regulator [Methanomassiliicoccales archaeon]HPR97736.1 LysR family transcriptional regulator [Methanomassiliicoccales archaeon]